MKKLLFLLPLLFICGCGQDFNFWMSHTKSSWLGLNRHIRAYSMDGKLLQEWETDSKIEWAGQQASFFDNKGKRIDIVGATIISEEK